MVGTRDLLLVTGVTQLLVGFLILRADGRLRLRGSLFLLFLLNGAASLLGYLGGPQPDAFWQPLIRAVDAPTGALLADAGVLLSGGALARFEKLTGAVSAVAVAGFPVAFLFSGRETAFLWGLADFSVMVGFLVVLGGTLAGLARAPASPFHVAAFLAFAPRTFEYAIIVGIDALRIASGAPVPGFVTLMYPWRAPFFLGVLAVVCAALLRSPRAPPSPLAIALGIGALAQVGARAAYDPFLFPVLTLLLSRPVFIFAALLLSSPGDLLHLSRRDLVVRSSGAAAGMFAGVALSLLLRSAPATTALLGAALALVGFAAAGLPFEARQGSPPPGTPGDPPGLGAGPPVDPQRLARFAAAVRARPLSRADRLLLALRGVEFDPAKTAPAAAGTSALSACTGIPGKHVPEVVLRLNERGPPSADRVGGTRGAPLILSDTGSVEATRQPGVPRYRLSALGRAESDALAVAYGLSDLDPAEIRALMRARLRAETGENEPGAPGER